MRTRNRTGLKLFSAASALLGLSLFSSAAQATPAFARQMDMNCMACHNQSIPMLNAFGRQFKLSSFSMVNGNSSMIDGGDLGMSLPLAINAGFGVKSQHLATDNSAGRDDLKIPAGASVMIGGRIAEDAGANILFNGNGVAHMQVAFSKPAGSGRIGATIFGTEGHGPFIATEAYNTGLHKELQMFDNSGRTNAAQATGLAKGPTSGVTAFYGGNGLTAAVGMWTIGFNSTFSDDGVPSDNLGSLYRLSYDIPVGGWVVSVGAYGVDSTVEGVLPADVYEATVPGWDAKLDIQAGWYTSGTTLVDIGAVGNGFDLQAVGSIAGMSTMATVNHIADYEFSVTNSANPLQSALLMDATVTSLEFQIMPTSAWGLRLGHMMYGDNKGTGDYDTLSFGVNYNYADNVRFSLENSNIDYDAAAAEDFSETMLTVLLAF